MRILYLLFLLFTVAGPVRSQAPLRLPAFTDGYLDISVKDNFQAFFDSSGQMSCQDVASAAFVPFDSLRYPRGILRHNDCRIWLRCRTDSLSRRAADTTSLYWHFNLRQTKVEGFRIGADESVRHFEWGQAADGRTLSTLFLLPFEASGQPNES